MSAESKRSIQQMENHMSREVPSYYLAGNVASSSGGPFFQQDLSWYYIQKLGKKVSLSPDEVRAKLTEGEDGQCNLSIHPRSEFIKWFDSKYVPNIWNSDHTAYYYHNGMYALRFFILDLGNGWRVIFTYSKFENSGQSFVGVFIEPPTDLLLYYATNEMVLSITCDLPIYRRSYSYQAYFDKDRLNGSLTFLPDDFFSQAEKIKITIGHPATAPIAQEPIAQEPIAQEPIAQEPIAQEPIAQKLRKVTYWNLFDIGSLPEKRMTRFDGSHLQNPGFWLSKEVISKIVNGAFNVAVSTKKDDSIRLNKQYSPGDVHCCDSNLLSFMVSADKQDDCCLYIVPFDFLDSEEKNVLRRVGIFVCFSDKIVKSYWNGEAFFSVFCRLTDGEVIGYRRIMQEYPYLDGAWVPLETFQKIESIQIKRS
jgi:hypothetical protein